ETETEAASGTEAEAEAASEADPDPESDPDTDPESDLGPASATVVARCNAMKPTAPRAIVATPPRSQVASRRRRAPTPSRETRALASAWEGSSARMRSARDSARATLPAPAAPLARARVASRMRGVDWRFQAPGSAKYAASSAPRSAKPLAMPSRAAPSS